MKNTVILLMLATASQLAWAGGHEVRNGGSAVVCYETDGKTIKSIELYDYWEMKQILGTTLEVDLGPDTWSVEDKIRYFAKRLEFVDPYRAQRYLTAGLSILSQLPTLLRDDLGIVPIADDDAKINPTTPCVKELFALQIREPLPGQTRFMIRRDLFESPITSNTTRAGIILHEVIYRDAIETDAKNSAGSRSYNYLVASAYGGLATQISSYEKSVLKPNKLSYKEIRPFFSPQFKGYIHLNQSTVWTDSDGNTYAEIIWPNELKLKAFTANWPNPKTTGLRNQFVFNRDGELVDLNLPSEASAFAWINQQYTTLAPYGSYNQYQIRLKPYDMNGDVMKSAFKGTLNVTVPGAMGYSKCNDYLERSPYTFETINCSSLSNTTINTTQHGRIVTMENAPIQFYANQYNIFLKSTYLGEDADLTLTGTRITKKFKRNTEVAFSPVDAGASSGTLSNPFDVVILGQNTKIYKLEEIKAGTSYINLSRDFNPARINNLPILNTYQAATGFCLQSGFYTHGTTGKILGTKKYYVSGQREFYDSSRSKSVFLTDQDADVIESLNCSGRYYFTIPQ